MAVRRKGVPVAAATAAATVRGRATSAEPLGNGSWIAGALGKTAIASLVAAGEALTAVGAGKVAARADWQRTCAAAGGPLVEHLRPLRQDRETAKRAGYGH